MDATSPSPQLQPPGAGLPPLEAFLARRVIIPLKSATTCWSAASAQLREEATRIRDITLPLDDATFRERVLVDRFLGIEDSSRHWSPAMTLRHLVIVGEGILGIITQLRQGEHPNQAVSIAAVKPDPMAGPEQVGALRDHVQRYLQATSESAHGAELKATHPHPWFGGMNAHRWHVLAALHMGIHRQQIQKILAARG